MMKNDSKKQDDIESTEKPDNSAVNNKTSEKELTLEEKLKDTEDKLLRSLAEIENQRRRFEREIKDAFEFGSHNFAKESLSLLDNLQRAKNAIKNDIDLKESKDLDKFLENISIIEKDLEKLMHMEKNLILICIKQ